MNFADRFKELRKLHKLSQVEIAERYDIDRTTVGKWESNISTPSIETLKDLANYFDVTLDYLLGNSSNPKLNKKDERDIQRELEEMQKDFTQGTLRMNLDGEEIDDEIKEFILNNMENTLILAKIKAKEKFTPKKYRKK